MNNLYSALVALALTGALASCGEKKKNSNIIITHKPTAPAKVKTQKMSDARQSQETPWVGSTYTVVVKRTADPSLPVVQIDDHTRYYDNKITVSVLRADGSEFFNRTFKKQDFKSCLGDNAKDANALLGIVFVEAKGDQLHFAASVGSPDIASDEYVPLVLKISRMGAVSISEDMSMDTDGDEKTSSDEDEV